jgi:hypothetical protein
MENAAQHWVPKTYLDAWCDPHCPAGHEPFLWLFEKAGSEPKKKSPKNVFRETDMYTRRLPDGRRDLSLETCLGKLENAFPRVRAATAKRIPLSDSSHADLILFIATAFSRSRSNRGHWQEQWGEIDSVMDKFSAAIKQCSPEERRNVARLNKQASRTSGRSYSHEDVKALKKLPLQHMLPGMVETLALAFLRFDLKILCTSDFIGFITSDSPCVWHDPEGYKRPLSFEDPL